MNSFSFGLFSSITLEDYKIFKLKSANSLLLKQRSINISISIWQILEYIHTYWYMYETGIDEIQIHRKKRPKYLIKQQLYSNLGLSFEVMTTTAHSCSVLNLNHPLWHETCKLSNNNDWISAMWSMIKILLSVWPMTFIYIHIELCMMLFYFICQRKYCFILYSFTYSHICTHTCWIEFLDGIPDLVHEHIWNCSFSIKLCPFEC